MSDTSLLANDFSESSPTFSAPTRVSGISEQTDSEMRKLVKVWQAKKSRNKLRTAYVDGKHRLDHIGFSIPPQMKDVEEVVGWPAKAVESHAQRCMFDGFVSTAAPDDPFELNDILVDNRFDIELQHAIRSSMTHSVAFCTITRGDTQSGEPPVLVNMHSAQWSAGLWDFRHRRMKSGIVINDRDDLSRPTAMTIYMHDRIVRIVKKGVKWVGEEIPTALGRVQMEPLPYRPDIDRPFGRSIITRPVMSITDDAVRTIMRTEVSAEFYSAPQLMLMGADPETFMREDGTMMPVWEAIIGRINMISRDENGDVPVLQQISQQSVQPHIEQMRELASRFAGETNVPLHSLGIIVDNPSSAEAMHAAEKDLVIDCLNATKIYGAALRRVAQDIVLIRDGSTTADMGTELKNITARWRNPALPSVIDSGDAMIKLISAFPWLAETTVALEEVGFTDEQITRLLSDKRKLQAQATLQALLGGDNGQPDAGEPAGSQPEEGSTASSQ